ncbi:hypothetical protein CDD80_2215 [Ophiocordyceps camponoti-rufipedis]|uniref:chitinase n=1 Tax=Ophiocordyceps camponoti-rufipedis TaxID=2004952 RepID=A0A2C5Z7D3_9HYPO|nr:hypothetical protein CDD80_2215 [Ophiocordyceps camponoti-rufipedis]
MFAQRFAALAGLGLAMFGIVAAIKDPSVFLGYVQYSDELKVDDIAWEKFTHIQLAFAFPQKDGSIIFNANKTAKESVKKIHDKGTKVLMSIGGFTESRHFSTIVADEALGDKFIDSAIGLMQDFDLDGVDMDWEFPGRPGCSYNALDKENDTKNYQKFMAKMRQKVDDKFPDPRKLITAAVRVESFDGPQGPEKDLSGFVPSFDWLLLMAYDVNSGSADVTGPNAPLDFETGKGKQFSLNTAIGNWTSAGFPKDKLLAGMPYYCRSNKLTEDADLDITNQYQPQEKETPLGDPEDKRAFDECSNETLASGVWRYKHAREQGILQEPDKAGNGFQYQFQTATTTVTLLNNESRIIMSCDTPKSLRAKSAFAKEAGLLGVGIWSLDMDPNNELTDAINQGWDEGKKPK